METKQQNSIFSFPPVSAPDARVLILGSMPGEASLAAGEYYAHPRNLFWRIMGEITGAGHALPYEERINALKRRRIALWDVLQCCSRKGSLDSAIRDEAPNDFAGFFASHPHVRAVFFNGAKAHESFDRTSRIVLARGASARPGTRERGGALAGSRRLIRLPSTSPAHASLSFEKKLAAWRAMEEWL